MVENHYGVNTGNQMATFNTHSICQLCCYSSSCCGCVRAQTRRESAHLNTQVVNALLQAEKQRNNNACYIPSILGDWLATFFLMTLEGSSARWWCSVRQGFLYPSDRKSAYFFGTPGSTAPQSPGQLEIGTGFNAVHCCLLTGPAQYLGRKTC